MSTTVQPSIDYTHTNDAETLDLNFTVSYTWERGDKGDWDNPPTSGGPVDVVFRLDSITPIRDFTTRKPDIACERLSPRWVAKTEASIDVLYDNDSDFRDRVQTAICEEEGEKSQDCRW